MTTVETKSNEQRLSNVTLLTVSQFDDLSEKDKSEVI